MELEAIAKVQCEVCENPLLPNTPCPICGWDGKTKYLDPYEDKEHFDQELYDSITPPKKPASAKKVFFYTSIPGFAILILFLIIFPDLFALLLTLLMMELLPISFYFSLKRKEKEWSKNMQNLEEYKISQYNILKPQKDKDKNIQQKITQYNIAPIKYMYVPSSIGWHPIARYSAHTGTYKHIEVIIEESTFFEIPFSQIIGSQVLEDAEIRGGVGRAIAGGFLAGDAGAIVGASTAKKSVTSFIVRIQTNNIHKPAYDIPLISSCVATDSKKYKEAIAFANDVQASIKAIVSTQQPKPVQKQPNTPPKSAPSAADEILKYKGLMDNGIITQEEFEAKKKQLLNL